MLAHHDVEFLPAGTHAGMPYIIEVPVGASFVTVYVRRSGVAHCFSCNGYGRNFLLMCIIIFAGESLTDRLDLWRYG